MKRREFARLMGMTGLGLAAKRFLPETRLPPGGESARPLKQWVWIGTDADVPVDVWEKRFAAMKKAGIDAILPEIYNSRQAFYRSAHLPTAKPWLETILPVAARAGLEVHAWMWTMPCNVEAVVDKHPEWFVVNRRGESSAVKPAYVDYYKFLCPSRPEVWDFVRETVSELAGVDGLTGIHLDYVRYPDVILPSALQPRYHIIQDKEYPEYDYCYCDVCRNDFKKDSGVDPIKIDDPSTNAEWNQFRYDRITHIVNDILLPVAHKGGKQMTAAVFPNWKNVRQEWSQWKLDGFLPMLYAGFYNEGIEWIVRKTKEEVDRQRYGAPVYSGLFVGQLSPGDIASAVRLTRQAGASGVSLFSSQSMNDAKWSALENALSSLKKS